jgi:hypothetical protein
LHQTIRRLGNFEIAVLSGAVEVQDVIFERFAGTIGKETTAGAADGIGKAAASAFKMALEADF